VSYLQRRLCPAFAGGTFGTVTSMSPGRPVRVLVLSLLVALAATGVLSLAACGSGDDDESGSATPAEAFVSHREDFPRPSGRSLRGLIGNMRQGPALAPSVKVLRPGTNRFAFGLFDRGSRQIGGLEVALYLARGVDETLHGPYAARYEPIQVEGRYRSRTTAEDPESAKSIYVARLPFRAPGPYLVAAVVKFGREQVATSPAQVRVTEHSSVPAVGDRAIRVHTPTLQSVAGDASKIDTRVPPDTMHDVDLADALDRHRPVILLFATPALCTSRVCGPVADVTEQVKASYGDKADFIHMEIYNDNNASKGVRPQVAAWGLKTEPYLFAIDRRGIVADRLDGAFSVSELEAAVHKALR
jgi:hypothetical protein